MEAADFFPAVGYKGKLSFTIYSRLQRLAIQRDIALRVMLFQYIPRFSTLLMETELILHPQLIYLAL